MRSSHQKEIKRVQIKNSSGRRGFLPRLPYPLLWGKVRMGDKYEYTPHLISSPARGEERKR